MASANRLSFDRGTIPASGPVLRALALAILVVLAPVGGLGGDVRADQTTVRLADGQHLRSDVQPSGPIERLHAAGVTGDNVTVGVLDVSGYDTSNPTLSGQVAASKTFGAGSGVPFLGRNAHGTATASIVAEVAPDADLYLASFTTPEDYREGFDWLLDNEVDVVVLPFSFYGQPHTGRGTLSDPIVRASRSGTTVVAAAGNLGQRSWHGTFQPGPRGRHRFDTDARNRLLGNESRVTIWLHWPRTTDANFSIELYRRGTRTPIAMSENFTRDDARNERLVATVDPDREHFFVVRGPALSDGQRISVESSTHRFEYATQHGSVAQPALHDDVISVGAYDVGQASVAPYSAAGPVDGMTGVDVVAPTNLVAPGYPRGFEGTSPAAAYTAGLAALVHDTDPDATPGHVEALLERTSRDAGSPGPDTIAGYGVVEPERLIEVARNETSAPMAREYRS